MRDSGMKFHAKPEGKWLCRVNVKVKAISKKRWFSAHNLGRFLGPEGGTLYNGLYGKVEWYMKGYGVGPWGGAFPHKSLLSTPSPLSPHRVFKISVKSRLNYCNFYGVKRGGWPPNSVPSLPIPSKYSVPFDILEERNRSCNRKKSVLKVKEREQSQGQSMETIPIWITVTLYIGRHLNNTDVNHRGCLLLTKSFRKIRL